MAYQLIKKIAEAVNGRMYGKGNDRPFPAKLAREMGRTTETLTSSTIGNDGINEQTNRK